MYSVSINMMTLWTPTNWKAETALRIKYIGWLVKTNGLPCFRRMFVDLKGMPPSSPEDIVKLFSEQGFLIVNSEDSLATVGWKVPSFEEWREQWVWVDKDKKIWATNEFLSHALWADF